MEGGGEESSKNNERESIRENFVIHFPGTKK